MLDQHEADNAQVRLLGPVDVTVDGSARSVSGRRRTAVLAVLGLHSGQVVGTDRLIDAVWGDRPPATAVNTLQAHVSYLRRLFGARTAIVARASGYVLNLAADATDVEVAERLIREGTQAPDPAQGAARLRAALALWRGPALVDVAGIGWFDEQAERLEQLRRRAELALAQARMTLGEHEQLVPGLQLLATQHPLDEQIHGHLILAHYRCGRQTDALAVYHKLRRRLAEDLGIEPGAALRDLAAAMLRQDDALQFGSVTTMPSAGSGPVPRELPPAVAPFIGRQDELATIHALWSATTPAAVVVVSGSGGVGKTALAVTFAHQVAHHFPDGQLYVDLRGTHPDQPMRPEQALVVMLGSLGVRVSDIPAELSAHGARLRSLLASRRMLLLLDNAFTAEQVRPLLPGTSACPVIVTSRDELAGLVARDGAHRVRLDVLPLDGALQLLRALLGKRARAEEKSIGTLAEQCARLPLALRVAADLAATHPETSVGHLVAELADSRHRLDLLDAGADQGTAVRAVFSWSLRRLPAEVRRMFCLLGLHPGRDVDAAAAAALAGVTEEEGRRLLAALGRGHLVERRMAGRWGMHDLLRIYAEERATEEIRAADRASATERLDAFYLSLAAAAVTAILPQDRVPRPGVEPPEQPFGDSAQAKDWLDRERGNLAAIVQTAGNERAGYAMELAVTLAPYLHVGYHNTEALAMHRWLLAAAECGNGPATQAVALYELGRNRARSGHYAEAIEFYQRALVRYVPLTDPVGEAVCHNGLGVAELHLGHYPAAAAHYRRALHLYRAAADRSGQGRALANLGQVLCAWGHYDEAMRRFERAATIFGEVGDRVGAGRILNDLGNALQRRRRHDEAGRYHEKARQLLHEVGDRAAEACAVTDLGRVHSVAGRHAEAFQLHESALTMFQQIDDRVGVAETLIDLGNACLRAARYTDGLDHLRQAYTLAVELEDRRLQSIALNAQGRCLRASQRPAEALTAHLRARARAEEIDEREAIAWSLDGIAAAYQTLGRPDKAHRFWTEALAMYAELGLPEADDVRDRLHQPVRVMNPDQDPAPASPTDSGAPSR